MSVHIASIRYNADYGEWEATGVADWFGEFPWRAFLPRAADRWEVEPWRSADAPPSLTFWFDADQLREWLPAALEEEMRRFGEYSVRNTDMERWRAERPFAPRDRGHDPDRAWYHGRPRMALELR